MKSMTERSAQILANDREWFCRHPEEAVRFRPIQTDEFKLLESNGISPPEFKPSWCKPKATLEHVAVVDLTRLLQGKQTDGKQKETIRIRIATIRARSKKIKANLKKELTEAIYRELSPLSMSMHDQPQTASAYKTAILAA